MELEISIYSNPVLGKSFIGVYGDYVIQSTLYEVEQILRRPNLVLSKPGAKTVRYLSPIPVQTLETAANSSRSALACGDTGGGRLPAAKIGISLCS